MQSLPAITFVDQVNSFYIITLALSVAAFVSGIVVLYMGTHDGKHFFANRPFLYIALNVSALINVFFMYNIILWLSRNFTIVGETDFHIRWVIYHTLEKMAIFMLHYDLFKRVMKWRAENAVTRE